MAPKVGLPAPPFNHREALIAMPFTKWHVLNNPIDRLQAYGRLRPQVVQEPTPQA